MPSRINIGPEDGPYVELDEESGEFVIRVPEDEVNFDQSDITNVKDFTAESVSTEDLESDDHTTERLSITGILDVARDDTELDGLLAGGGQASWIQLGQNNFSANRTGDDRIVLRGVRISGPGATSNPEGAYITSDWEIDPEGDADQELHLENLNFQGGDLILSGNHITVFRCAIDSAQELRVSGNGNTISHIFSEAGTEIIFEAGSENGEVGIINQGVSVTDNGNNSILGGT